MLGQVFTLFLFFTGHWGQDFTHNVTGLSGTSLCLQPSNIKPKAYSVTWRVQLSSDATSYVILTLKNDSSPNYKSLALNHFNNRLQFTIKNLTLHIKAVQRQDSGSYTLEVVSASGGVSTTRFQVLVFDHVEKPRLQAQVKALDRGLCRVTLSCLVSSNGDVSYAWYNGSELIPMLRNVTHLEPQIDTDGLYTYTCEVSNPVSWANDTLNLTQQCLNAHKKSWFLPFLVVIVVLLITLLLSTLAFFYVKRKRKQSKTSTEEFLTIYADVNDVKIRRNQKQQQEQNFPGEGTTIYCMIQSQHSASTSQDKVNTIYSSVQPFCKVGTQHPRAPNRARLSQKELENFHIYF
ncbi:natural killer cell receptor 2B4 isoform X2 [Tamandua tetradactyla]|uniref:natural killer cell receptor 2B4 isoform X2 n=1 Tax=Tamandua tetradactyla TaxID=48850 RepID=UPI00405448F4